MQSLDAADLHEGDVAEAKVARLNDKIAAMKAQLGKLRDIGKEVLKAPDQHVSLTDPDARAMATNLRGASVVGYNIQTAVDTAHHLIVAHKVTNIVSDRTLLSPMA